MEALLEEFHAANTQVLGVSVDSVHCHANWAQSLGGVSFPLLSDFHPKGAMARAYGLYLEEAGITDRATVIIDAGGTVRHASSVTPAGVRDPAELLKLAQEIDAAYEGELEAASPPEGLSGDLKLYVKTGCGFSLRALLARENLHLQDAVQVCNISDSEADGAALEELTGGRQVPCLVVDGEPMLESGDIVNYLVGKSARWA